ncbi:prepilin-type N-terminal cleavage/methylation domain-containing protein [Candidatus Pelagibacter sp.]|nr:prepilin-type N-terminal cleavage/methylation domain-containing protein [Candidatus Pelagibacter sp.]
MSGFYSKQNRGLTLIEALVATVIVGIGFVAVFQMVQYSVRSIDISSDRNKGGYLVNIIAEDVLANKRTRNADGKDFPDILRDDQWSIRQCINEFTEIEETENTPAIKVQSWNEYFDYGITKCRSDADIRALTIIDICNNVTSVDKTFVCTYVNNRDYPYLENGTPVVKRYYDQIYFGKMEIKFNKGRKKRNLYFQIK